MCFLEKTGPIRSFHSHNLSAKQNSTAIPAGIYSRALFHLVAFHPLTNYLERIVKHPSTLAESGTMRHIHNQKRIHHIETHIETHICENNKKTVISWRANARALQCEGYPAYLCCALLVESLSGRNNFLTADVTTPDVGDDPNGHLPHVSERDFYIKVCNASNMESICS